jgi:non-ribosomal peptide synthetase component F
VPWQYRHYVRWQHRRTTAEQWRSDEEYWRAQLEGVRPPGPWHGDRDLSELPGGATIHLDLDGPVTDRIGELARVEQATPFTVLLAFFYQALHQESGLSDLCVAAPFANRVRPETAGTVGLFANLVMLRTHLDGDEAGGAGRAGDRVGLTDLLRRTRRTVNAAMAHQEYPYYLLSAGTTGTRADRLDDVVFQMVPALPAPVSAGELEVEVLAPELHSRFDLELVVIPNPTGLRVRLQYARHRVADDVARRLADRYRSAVERTFAESVTPAP